MHWILQSNLINPRDRDLFEQAFKAQGVSYSRVRLFPFSATLDGEPTVPAGPVFVYGSTSLGLVAKERGWNPGYFDENLDYELMLAHYGDLALNAGAVCEPLEKLTRRWDRFFIRPVLDNKSFGGMPISWDEFEVWRAQVAKVADAPGVTLLPSHRVVMAPLQDVSAEYRLIVVNGRVVTGSRYKRGDTLSTSSEVPDDVLFFTQDCIARWAPNKAFTMDVADTRSGLKVIELNSANSAGLYDSDVDSFVRAVNTLL